jgi:hypothetical protein
MKGLGDFQPAESGGPGTQGAVGGPWDYAGRNVAFGVREHAMGAAVNGMAAHGGVLPFSATFLVFSDYMKPAIRLGALSRLKAFYVFRTVLRTNRSNSLPVCARYHSSPSSVRPMLRKRRRHGLSP